jgi:hypothetical protein
LGIGSWFGFPPTPSHARSIEGSSERVLGSDHPYSLVSRNNLAGAYQAAGRLGEAIPLYERALADCERVLGPDHPYTRGARENLAAATPWWRRIWPGRAR